MIGKLFNITIVVAVLAGGAFWYAPYSTAKSLENALENEDPIKVDQYVDFEAVKLSLNDDFAKKLKIDTGSGDSSFGSTLATRIASTFISAIVSPETMVSVLKDKERRNNMGLSDDMLNLVSRGSWHGASQFILYDDDNEPKMLFERHGLMSWTVTGLRIN